MLTIGLAGAPSALADTRYAAPTGTVAAPCSAASPCDIITAVNGKAGNMPVAGDQVILTSGVYGSPAAPITTALAPPVPLTVRGAAGPRPTVYGDPSSGNSVFVFDVGEGALAHVAIETAHHQALYGGGIGVDDVVAHSSGPGQAACEIDYGVELTNSVCWSSGASGIGIFTNANGGFSHQNTVQNSDAYATATSGRAVYVHAGINTATSMTLGNTIMRGVAKDVAVNAASPGGSATVQVDHSDYVSTVVQAPSSTIVDGGHNITADPLLAAPAGGNFHETDLSPTIGAGKTAAPNGMSDFDGQPRSLAGLTDIGADEYLVAPAVAAGAPAGVRTTSATLRGTVAPGNAATSYSFHYGTTPATTSSLPGPGLLNGRVPQAVEAHPSGLPPATRIYWRLTATNSQGSSSTPVQEFATLARRPRLAHLSLRPRRLRVGHNVIRIAYRDVAVATSTFTVWRRAAGVRSGSRCISPSGHRVGRRVRRCARYVRRATFSHLDSAGVNRLRFTGRFRHPGLSAGLYRLTVRAENSAGGSNTLAALFRVTE